MNIKKRNKIFGLILIPAGIVMSLLIGEFSCRTYTMFKNSTSYKQASSNPKLRVEPKPSIEYVNRFGIRRKLNSTGFVGSHTLTHVNLGSISQDKNRIFEEITNSKKMLENTLKIPVDYFAYPYGCKGSYNKTTEDIIKESGYKAACTNIHGLNKIGVNVFELKRTRISWNDTLLKFRMKL